MREEIAATGRLVAQIVTESIAIDRDEQQIVLAREVARGRFPRLLCRREMEVPINNVDGSSLKDSGCFSLPPERFGTYLKDDFHEGLSSCATLKEQPECESPVIKEDGRQAEP